METQRFVMGGYFCKKCFQYISGSQKCNCEESKEHQKKGIKKEYAGSHDRKFWQRR